MRIDQLYNTDAPFLHVAQTSASEIANFAWSLTQHDSVSVAVRFLRGRKMTTVSALFDEFVAALQFPPYFGENWDAFEECITDLSWLPADCYILVVTDADALLRHEPVSELETFLTILQDAGDEWSHSTPPCDPERDQGVAFHSLLQAEESNAAELIAKLNSIGVLFDEVHLSPAHAA